MKNNQKQFDTKNGIITNIKPYEIVAVVISRFKTYGKDNLKNQDTKAYIPMYWYANTKEEAEEIKKAVSEELSKESVEGDIIIRHLPVIVIDIKAKRILKGAGVGKGIESVIACDYIKTIDNDAFDKETKIINKKVKRR